MLLRKEFMRILFVFALILATSWCRDAEQEQDISLSNRPMVADIIKKISILRSNYLSQLQTENKSRVFDKIEHKLKNTAQSVGADADKYVDLIMQGVKLKNLDIPNKNASYEIVQPSIEIDALRTDPKETSNNVGLENENIIKEEMIRNIAQKIENLSKNYLKNAKTSEDKIKALEQIKNKIMEAAQKNVTEIHNTHADIKMYKELIAKGMELMMQRTLSEDDGRRNNIEIDDDMSDMEIEVMKDENLLDSSLGLDNMDALSFYKYYNAKSNSSLELCNTILEETCYTIQSLNKLTCFNGKNVPIQKLCDGVRDCGDGSDEVNCTMKAIEKLRTADNLMSDIESSVTRKCIKKRVADTIITPQNQVLRDVLQTQLTYLEKYRKNANSSSINGAELVEYDFIKTLNDVALVFSTLALALDGIICSPRSRSYGNVTESLEDLEEEPSDVWSPRSCLCHEQFCSEKDCATPCRRVCWQKYSLDHWGCQASNGGNSVTLDVLCDGKLDCFDESDENMCAAGAYTRFESITIYKEAMDIILAKTKLKEYEASRNKLLLLHGLVKRMQKLTTTSQSDSLAIKQLRRRTFQTLVEIYEHLMQTATLQELNNAYIFLLAINAKLVLAMKRSRTGNDRLLSSNECFCMNSKCAMWKCSKKCIKACKAEPRLTRYVCRGDENTSISIDSICNDINDCPNADDEINCKKEICRPHHLVMLRRGISGVGQKKRGTALGEVLLAWRTKVIATIVMAENNHRITPRMILDVVTDILRDLVRAYSHIEDKGPRTEYIFKEFQKAANIVMSALKFCGK